MKEIFSDNPEFFHKKRKCLAHMKSGKPVDTGDLIKDDELMSDKEVVLCMLQTQGGDMLQHVSADLRDDEQVVFQACSNEGVDPPMNDAAALRYASDRVRSSEEFVTRLKKYWLERNRADQVALVQRYTRAGT